MNISEISNITKTINQFNTVFENSGLTELHDTFKQISETIHCSFQPIIELSEKWNKTQEEIFGSIKPALDNISEFSNKVSESIHSIPTINFPDYPKLLDAYEKYEKAAPPCLYTPPEIVILPKNDYSDTNLATKDDVQELRMEIQRLNKVIILTRREKSMNQNEFSDEAEYIYQLIYNHYKNGSASNHSVMIEQDEFSNDINEDAFELGLEELQSQRYIAGYESYIDGSYHIDLCLRCTKALKEGKTKVSESQSLISIKQKPAILIQVMSEYPQFEKDYELLLSNKYFEEAENGLHWLKKKQCLAEYFGDQRFPNKWNIIEKLFNETNLKALYNNKEYESKDYKDLQTLLKK